jgi:hemolysin III
MMLNRTAILQQHREEVANTITHGAGAVLALIAGSLLLAATAMQGDTREIVSVAIFVIALVLLYSFSTLYHAERKPLRKRYFKILDHCAIFLLIAGSYTPFTLVALQGAWGWSLFAVIWSLALIGIAFKLFFTGRFKLLSTSIYVAMGWLAIIAIVPMVKALSTPVLLWLLAGGLLYTSGTLFYHRHSLPYAHAIWHGFVLGGSVCHFIAVSLQVLSPA